MSSQKMTEKEIYGSFDELEHFLDIDLCEYLTEDEDDVFDNFMMLLPKLEKEDKLLHGLYQMIFLSIDINCYSLAQRLYDYMTNDGTVPIGEKTNAFLYYCLHKNNRRGVLECLARSIVNVDEVDDIPFEEVVNILG